MLCIYLYVITNTITGVTLAVLYPVITIEGASFTIYYCLLPLLLHLS